MDHKINEGLPAFTTLTKLEYFTGQALAGLCANPVLITNCFDLNPDKVKALQAENRRDIAAGAVTMAELIVKMLEWKEKQSHVQKTT